VRSPILEEAQHRFHAQIAPYMPTSLAEELSRRQTSVTYVGGSTLISQGSPADVVLWIISGIVKVYCLVPAGNRVLVKLARPGDVLGYPALVVPEGRALQPFEAQALTKCTVAMFSRDTILRLIEKLDQPTLIRLTEHFNQSWSLIAHRLVTFLGSAFRQRLELTFEDLASRFGVEDERAGRARGIRGESHARAREEDIAFNVMRYKQIAHGGIFRLPVHDKDGRLLKDKDTGELFYEDVVMLPDRRALADLLRWKAPDRYPGTSSQKTIEHELPPAPSEAARPLDLREMFLSVTRRLSALGIDFKPAVETTAKPVKPEPEMGG
jgi:CRP-like cAMP-binding protein